MRGGQYPRDTLIREQGFGFKVYGADRWVSTLILHLYIYIYIYTHAHGAYVSICMCIYIYIYAHCILDLHKGGDYESVGGLAGDV